MKHNIQYCILLIFATLTAWAAPRLAVPPEGVAFGEIAAGESASKSIELRNASLHRFQMAQWSSRNVILAKIALGVVFVLLAVLMVFVVLLPAR